MAFHWPMWRDTSQGKWSQDLAHKNERSQLKILNIWKIRLHQIVKKLKILSESLPRDFQSSANSYDNFNTKLGTKQQKATNKKPIKSNYPIQPKLDKTKSKTIKCTRKLTNPPQKLSKSVIINWNKQNPEVKIGPFQQEKKR